MLVKVKKPNQPPAHRAIEGELPSPHPALLFEPGQKFAGLGRYDADLMHTMVRAPEQISLLAIQVVDLIDQGRLRGDDHEIDKFVKCWISSEEKQILLQYIGESRKIVPAFVDSTLMASTDLVAVALNNPNSPPLRTPFFANLDGDQFATQQSSKTKILRILNDIEKRLNIDPIRISREQSTVLHALAHYAVNLTLKRNEWTDTLNWKLDPADLIARVGANFADAIHNLMPDASPGDQRRLVSAFMEEYIVRQAHNGQLSPVEVFEKSLAISTLIKSRWFTNATDCRMEFNEFLSILQRRNQLGCIQIGRAHV